MKALIELGKYIGAVIFRNLFRILFFPAPIKKNRILFDSFTGEQYSCNPRALYEYMQAKEELNIEFIWAFRNPEKYSFLTEERNTTICRYRSLKHYYYSLTSGVIVFNFTRTNELPFRKKQIRLQTWHGGGCYKKVGLAIGYNSGIHNWILTNKAKTDMTHFVSSSDYFTENIVRDQYLFRGCVLETGMPRNDCFFNQKKMKDVNLNVRKKYSIGIDDFVVLYAPTFRDENISDVESLDFEAVKKAVSTKICKKVIILYRGHHFNKELSSKHVDLDVSNYFDMQDLLITADMLITDYSSSIWDYSFTGKPCLLFTPDLEYYQEYRGFDRDIYTWGFPVCNSNEILVNTIATYDERFFKEAMEKHHSELGSYEKGIATREISTFLLEQMK